MSHFVVSPKCWILATTTPIRVFENPPLLLSRNYGGRHGLILKEKIPDSCHGTEIEWRTGEQIEYN